MRVSQLSTALSSKDGNITLGTSQRATISTDWKREKVKGDNNAAGLEMFDANK